MEEGKSPVIILDGSRIVRVTEINLVPESEGEVIYEGEYFRIDGNAISGTGVDDFTGEGKKVKVTTMNGEITKISENSIIDLKGITHQVKDTGLNFYYVEDFDSSKHKGENYFNYGDEKISMGGKGFIASLKEDNEFFPEYNDKRDDVYFDRREGKLEFSVHGGELEITKISSEGDPLGLDIKSSGKTKITNGDWNLVSDGDNIYATYEDDYQYSLSSDMQFEYQSSDGTSKYYDLDIDSTYVESLSEEELLKIDSLIEIENSKKIDLGEEYSNILANPEVIEYNQEIKRMEKEVDNFYMQYVEVGNQIWEVQGEISMEELSRLEMEKDRLFDKWYYSGKDLEDYKSKSPFYEELKSLERQMEEAEDRNISLREQKSEGEWKQGVWGQIISSENGDSQVSYSEFIEGFPVRKNKGARYHYDGEVRREKPKMGYPG